MKALAAYIMRGWRQAILVIAGLSLLALKIPIFGMINSVTIGLVTLYQGMRHGIVLIAISTALVSLALIMFPVATEEGGNGIAMGIAFWTVPLLVLWILCGVLRHWRSLQLALLAAAGFGTLVVSGFRLVVSDTTKWWHQSPYSEVFDSAVERIMAQQPMVHQQNLELISAYLVALVVAGFTLSVIIHLFFARGWQAIVYNPGGFRDEFFQLRLDKRVAIFAIAIAFVLMISGASSVIGFVGMAMLVLLVLLYMLYGIAVVSAIFAEKKWHWGWIIGAVVLAVIIGQLIIGSAEVVMVLVLQVFAILGFVDTFTDFRKRIKRQS